MLHKLTLEEAKKKHIIPNNNSKVILAGAGISIDLPTRLPSGQDLTEFYLKAAIGEENAQYIDKKWKDVSDIIERDTGNKFPFLRLEVIIDNINKVERKLDYNGMIHGFYEFSKRTSNENHKYLNKIAQQKKNIILTTNFDTCIENAFGRIKDFQQIYQNQCPAFYSETGTTIYHIHGIANEEIQNGNIVEYSLGATLENIKNGFPLKLGSEITTKFIQENYLMIFVGYSGSDFFDVTPFFENLPFMSQATAIFFCHGSKVTKEEEKRAKKLMKNFGTAYILNGNTTDFLRLLCGIQIDLDKKAIVPTLNTSWMDAFKNIIEVISDEERKLIEFQNGIRLVNQIGLNYPSVYKDWEKQLYIVLKYFEKECHLERFYMEPDLSATVIADLLKTCEQVKHLSPSIYEKSQKLSEILKSKRKNITTPLEAALKLSLSELLKAVEKKSPTPQNYNSSIVYSMNYHVKRHIGKWMEHPQDEDNLNCMLYLLKGLDKMLTMPYYKYMYLSYYITLLKLRNLLLSILRPEFDNHKDEEKMLEIALEISSISQVRKVYVNWWRKNVFLFKQTKKEIYNNKSLHMYDIIRQISLIAGNGEVSIEELREGLNEFTKKEIE